MNKNKRLQQFSPNERKVLLIISNSESNGRMAGVWWNYRLLSTHFLQDALSIFIHSFMPGIYIAPLKETYSGALSPATAKEKCLKKLAERRHIVPRQQVQGK